MQSVLKRLFSHEWVIQLLLLGLYLVIALVLLSPIFSNQMVPIASNDVNLNDYGNHIVSIVQAKMALAQGQFPLRVAPLEAEGWGYPLFQLYSSTSYTLAGLIYRWITPNNPFIAYKLMVILSLLLGGSYMYRLAKEFVSSRVIAVLASVVYLTTPYSICLVSYLSYFNEILAMGLLPCVIFYSWRCYVEPKTNYFIFMSAFFWYVLVTVHLISYLALSFFLTIFFILIAQQEKKWRHLLPVLCAYGFGCLLAIWYLAPLLQVEQYLNVKLGLGFVGTRFNAFSPGLSFLFSPLSHFNVPVDVSSKHFYLVVQPGLGLPIMLAMGMGLYLFFKRKSVQSGHSSALFMSLLLLFVLTFFIIWSPINFWSWLPNGFKVVELSQRVLLQLSWMGALLFAIVLAWFSNSKMGVRQLMVGIVLVVFSTSPWYFGSFMHWAKVSSIVHYPYLDNVRKDAYMIFPLRYRGLSAIDNMPVGFLFPKQTLQLNHLYTIPLNLWKGAYAARLTLIGQVSEKSSIQIILDGQLISTQALQPGRFVWTIPLSLQNKESKKSVTLEWVSKTQGKNNFKEVSLDQVLAEGYLNPVTTLSLQQAKPACVHNNKGTACNLLVAPNTQLLELPVLYYPDMLEITVNGKSVSYQSVLNGAHIITAIAPVPGQVNHIQAHFRGLVWANEVSLCAWLFWVASLFYYVLRRLLKGRS